MGSDLSARLGAALTRRGLWPDAFGMVCRCGKWVGTLWAVEMRGDEWSARLRGCGNQSFPVADCRPDLSAWPTVGVLLGLLAGEREVAVFGPSAPCVVDIWRVAWTAPDGWPHAFDEEAPSKLGRIGDALAAALLAAWGEP